MPTKVVTVANQKGGAGKTNVAMTVAACFAGRGYKVLVVDGDVQGTATQWYAMAPENESFPVKVINLSAAGGKIGRAMQDHMSDYEIVVVDTPGSLKDPVPLACLLLSDLALVPMIPAPGDLWSTTHLLELLSHAQSINTDLQVRVVPNQVQANKIAEASLEALTRMGLPVTQASLASRVVYRSALAHGTTVSTMKDLKAIEEVDALTDEVLALLNFPLKKSELKSA